MSCRAIQRSQAAVLAGSLPTPPDPFTEPLLPDTCVFRRARRAQIRELEEYSRGLIRAAKNPATRRPSVFTALTPLQAAVDCYAMGFVSEFADVQTQNKNKGCVNGLNGSNVDGLGQRTFGNVCINVRNDNATDPRLRGPNRSPSRFTALTPAQAAIGCVQQGWTLDLADTIQLNKNKGCVNGLNGSNTNLGGQRTFGNLCVESRFFGQ